MPCDSFIGSVSDSFIGSVSETQSNCSLCASWSSKLFVASRKSGFVWGGWHGVSSSVKGQWPHMALISVGRLWGNTSAVE